MNDNEATVPQQIAHLEAMANTMREDLAEARAGLLAKPDDDRLMKQVVALEGRHKTPANTLPITLVEEMCTPFFDKYRLSLLSR